MRNTPQRDTPPERRLRSALFALGLRYRVQTPPLSGVRRRADVVFPRERVAVFVDGCFWHSCPIHGTQPKANELWWAEKLAANRSRDADTDARLVAAGWISIRVWEHDDPAEAARAIGQRLGELRRDRPSQSMRNARRKARGSLPN